MFRVGQEVIYVGGGMPIAEAKYIPSGLPVNSHHVVLGLRTNPIWGANEILVSDCVDWIVSESFRPVAKRSDTLSIESFLVIRPGQYEEPRRVVEPVRRKAVVG